MSSLRQAFKEWAVICGALAQGRQALILRKGGIAEHGGVFEVEHRRFWLYPTYLHQQQQGVRREGADLLAAVQADAPAPGRVILSHFAEVADVYQVTEQAQALRLADLHLWSEPTVIARFHYRTPGLFVLPVRVYQIPYIHDVAETPAYAGCRSWVELDEALSTVGAVPVLAEEQFQQVLQTLRQRLGKDATAF
jgi:hypothetical protein